MKRAWGGKTRGGVAGYKIFVFLLKRFNISFAYFILRFVAFYYLIFSIKSSKAIFYYFNKRLRFGRLKSIIHVYRNYYVFGQTILDKIALISGLYTGFTYDSDGMEHMREMIAGKKGGILISAHIGNWEMAGHLLGGMDAKVNIVMFDAEHEKIKEYLSHVLSDKGVNIIVIKDDMSHIFEINRALNNNEFVCMHGDRYVSGSKLIELDFLGKKARFPTGPFVLASKFKVPVSYVFAMKEKKTHYYFCASQMKHIEYDAESGLEHPVTDYAEKIEHIIRKYPDQWFNYYPFWGEN